MTIWDLWAEQAQRNPDRDAIVHWRAGREPYRWGFSRLLSSASEISESLHALGIKKGQVCALILRHHPEFYPLYMAIVRLGAIPAILAYPNVRLHPDKFKRGLEGMCSHSGLDWILTERALEEKLAPLVNSGPSTVQGILFPLEWAGRESSASQSSAPVGPNDPLLLQHSSGTTGLQKPVLLDHEAVLIHVRNYGLAIGLSDQDKVVSWLPLYHDMGLIAAFQLPLASGIPSVQIDPFEWIADPVVLLEAVSKEKGTLTWMPNFAFNVMADKIHEEELSGLSLESWRMVINCSEPVRAESFRKFLGKFGSYGLKRTALSSCYAMAEATFAVTQTRPAEPPPVVCADKFEFAKGRIKVVDEREESKVCVSSGKAIPGCEIRIVDEEGRTLPEGRIGEILIRSDSLFQGYRNYPEKTAEVLQEGWYHSGDLGLLHRGDVFVTGRKKDLIIVGGNNIHPEDIEAALSEVEGVIPGRLVAFGMDDPELGSEQVGLIVETPLEKEGERKALRDRLARAAMAADIPLRKIFLAPPRWLVKSSSGKLSRKENKENVLREFAARRS